MREPGTAELSLTTQTNSSSVPPAAGRQRSGHICMVDKSLSQVLAELGVSTAVPSGVLALRSGGDE